MTYHSQLGQDEILNRELFHGRRNGVFVDVGAFDGVQFSNTLFLERELGWQGICIEPHPDVFPKLLANRNCKCVNVAAWHERMTLQFLKVASEQPQVEMLSGVVNGMDPRHTKRVHGESGTSELLYVQAVPILDLFAEYLLRDTKKAIIDYLTVDVENAELQVLKGVGFDKLHVNAVDFEVEHADTGDDLRRTAEIYDFLIGHGFRHHSDIGWDRVFINNNLKWSWST